MNAALVQLGEPEVMKLIDNIDGLRTILPRFTSQHARKSIEVFTLTQTTFKTIQDEIARCFAIHLMTNCQSQVENWENEGGRTENASV
jgi:hypothetical protein